MIDRSLELSKSVAGSGTESASYTPASGKKFHLRCMEGNSPLGDGSYVELTWDGVLVWTIWGERGKEWSGLEYTGDGVKQLTLKLINNEASAISMSGGVTALEY